MLINLIKKLILYLYKLIYTCKFIQILKMIDFELFNIVFDFMNDDEFMYSCSLVCKNDIFKKRRSNIYKTKRIQSLHNKINDYKDLEFDYDFDSTNKTQTHTLNMISVMASYLFLDGPLEPKYRGHSFIKYKHHKHYISTPTLRNLIEHPERSVMEILDFSERVKYKIRVYHSLCQIYRMPHVQKKLMKEHCPHAKALLY